MVTYNPDGTLQRVPINPIVPGGQATSNGVLGNTALSQTGILNPARMTAPLAPLPNQRIGLNEALIRIGGAGVEGAQQGGLQSFANMTKQYGAIEDYNRSRALDEYNAQIKMMNAMNKGKNKKQTSGAVSPYNATVLQTIDDIIPVLNDDIDSWLNKYFGIGGWTTGTFGQLLKSVGGTDAADLNAKLETLRSNIGFDRLQKMRMESPTGGALGSVSERELSQLNAALGSLEQSQSPEQLKQNILRIRDQYERAIIALQNDFAADGLTFQVPSQQSSTDLFSQADAIVGSN